jgi:para-nitrobenzyl esterase
MEIDTVRTSRQVLFALALITMGLTLTPVAQVHSHGPVTIDSGQVSGSLVGPHNDISVYKSIPYVAAPVGDLRWREPQPVAKWTGVREATSFRPIPPQRSSPQPQNEDSLYLNVWTPAKTSAERLPVMVWIYGGGFTYGSSSGAIYDGTRLSAHGVVVVSFNYRLNVLSGFAHPLLSKESGHGSGNYGLLDQIAGLNWVQRNIKAFGGDPGNVTIFGESAGGLSVSALLVSPMTKGLFHKAIIESGSGAQLTTLQSAERDGEALVKRMGLEGAPNLLASLRAKPWADIPDAQNYRGAPVLDGYAFTQHPRDGWAKGQQANVPMIVGYNLHEATFFTGRDGELPETLAAYQKSVRDRFGAQADQILRLYPAKTDQEAYWADVAIRTDQRMGLSARAQLRGMFSVTAKTWEYHFTYLPDVNKDSKRGVSHATELAYVFGTVPPTSDNATRNVSDAMMNYWTTFAKTGDPNHSGLPAWPAFAKGHESFLELGPRFKAGRTSRRRSWTCSNRFNAAAKQPALGDNGPTELGCSNFPVVNHPVHSLRAHFGVLVILLCCASTATPRAADGQPTPGIISGVVTDDSGNPIVGATVTWSQDESSTWMEVTTGVNGEFSVSRVPSGPYRLVVTSPGFANQIVSGVVPAGGTSRLATIRLTLAFNTASVDVTPTIVEVAERQIKEEEQQHLLGVMPNYFVVYFHDAAPLTAKQKFELSRKALLNPVDFAFTGIIAGVQHARNDYAGFGRGVSGYAKRYAAFYATIFTRSAIDQVLLPSLFKQDPRYFYKGTGSTASRIGYAIGTVVVRKGDNRQWQPNYSGIFGSLATGALTNFYYPAEDRKGVRLTVENSAIGLAASAAAHLAQEFLFVKLTTHRGPPDQPSRRSTSAAQKP